MKRKILVGILAGLGLGLCVGQTGAFQRAQEMFGVFYSYLSFEEYKISIGIDGFGRPRKPRPAEEIRENLIYPEFYGTVISITEYSGKTVLWMRDEKGNVRNAFVDDADKRLYRISPAEVTDYENKVSGKQY